MKARLILAALAGIALATVIVALVGVRVVAGAIRTAGWSGFALFCLSWLPVMAVLGAAWLAATPGLPARRIGVLVWARMLRDAAAEVLPFSQLGGILVGARAAIAAGLPGDLAVASTAADVIVEVAAQFLYTLLGIGLILARLGGTGSIPLLWPTLAALSLLFALGAGLMIGQKRASGWIARQVRRWLPDSLGRAEAAGAALDRIFRRRLWIAVAVALHLAGWIASAASSWLALRLMGVAVDLPTVIALESLMYALRNLGFALPGGLGVQEGAYVLLGPLFGVPAAEVLALSLLKRGRDLALGVPLLLAWQAHEGHRLIRSRAAGPGPSIKA